MLAFAWTSCYKPIIQISIISYLIIREKFEI